MKRARVRPGARFSFFDVAPPPPKTTDPNRKGLNLNPLPFSSVFGLLSLSPSPRGSPKEECPDAYYRHVHPFRPPESNQSINRLVFRQRQLARSNPIRGALGDPWSWELNGCARLDNPTLSPPSSYPRFREKRPRLILGSFGIKKKAT